MDSVPRYEFHGIFHRVVRYIDLKGKFTSEAIAEALREAIEKCRKLRRKAETAAERNRLKHAAIGYARLIEYGFPERVIREANLNPSGIVGMTLKYGAVEAKKRILAQKRAEIRSRLRRKRRYPQ